MSDETLYPNKSVQEIMNKQLDLSVTPLVVQHGVLGNASGSWVKLKVSASGALSNDDASNFRVSAVGLTANVSAIVAADDAGQFRVSAIQLDAGNFHISGFSPDAGLFRVSSFGATGLSANQSISAVLLGGTANIGDVSALSPDAGLFRVSGIGTFTTTGLSANQQVSAVLLAGTANIGYVSATIDNGSISAKQGDASNLRVSSFFVSLDTTNNVEKVESQFTFYYMSAVGIQTIKSSNGLLHSIVVNTRGTTSTLKVYDNTSAASGLQIANIDTTFSLGTFDYDVKFPNGLTISAAGASQADMTICYR